MRKSVMLILAAFAMVACISAPAAAESELATDNSRSLQGYGGKGGYPNFNAAFSQAQAAAQAASASGGKGGGHLGGCYDCYAPSYSQCQAAASAFASAGSSSRGRRRLMNWRNTFNNAFAQANANAGAASFGSPGWQNNFINACASQASASASSFSSGGRKLKGHGGKGGYFPNFNSAFAQAQAAAQAASYGSGGYDGGCYDCGYPSYNECQAAASAFASAGSSSGGRRRLMGWRDTFSNAFSQANANAGAASFGSPGWQNNFINACAAQASASASSFSGSGK